MAYVLAFLLASVIASSTESIVRPLGNNAKGGLFLCHVAAVRRQSSVAAVRTRQCIVEFLHDGTPIIDRVVELAIGTAPMQANGARHVRSRACIAKGPLGVRGCCRLCASPAPNAML